MPTVTHAVIRRYEEGVIGVPSDGKFIPVTNSELGAMRCMKRWWLGVVEGLSHPFGVNPLSRGSAWDLIMEDVYRWWETFDRAYPVNGLVDCPWCLNGITQDGEVCSHCDGSGEGVLERALERHYAALEDDPPPFTMEEVERERELLVRAFQGYIHHYEARPLQNFRIVGVKSAVGRVVINPKTGRAYRPDTLLVRTDAGWVRAGTAGLLTALGSGVETARVNWPVYQIGELDAVARDRSSGAGWVIDAKFTKAMGSYRDRLQVDPQLPGYCWALSTEEAMEHFGLTSVRGMMYDLTSSVMHGSPFQLKWKPPLVRDMKAMAADRGIDVKGMKAPELQAALGIVESHGGFSTSESKLAGVPSWRFRAACEAAGIDPGDYTEAIEWCERNVDGRLFSRPWRSFSDEELGRYSREVFGKARAATTGHRRAAQIESMDELDTLFPRTPLCAMPGGSCPFMGPCAQDSVEVREHFEQHENVIWRDGTEADTTINLQEAIGF